MQTENSMNNTPDYIRDVISWVVLVLIIGLLHFLRPHTQIVTRAMYLPEVTGLKPVKDENVKLISNNHFDNYFLYKKIGSITITMPYLPDVDKFVLQSSAIEQAKSLAGQAGANKLLVEGMMASEWFNTGNRVFRIQASALKD